MAKKLISQEKEDILKIKYLLHLYRNTEIDSFFAEHLFDWKNVSVGFAGQWQGINPETNKKEFVLNYVDDDELAKLIIKAMMNKFPQIYCDLTEDSGDFIAKWYLERSVGKTSQIEYERSNKLSYAISKSAANVLDFMGFLI